MLICAGKTTTVRMPATLIAQTAGSATVGRDSAAEIRRSRSCRSPGLYQQLTVPENREYFARLYGLPRREKRTAEALTAAGRGRAPYSAAVIGAVHQPGTVLRRR